MDPRQVALIGVGGINLGSLKTGVVAVLVARLAYDQAITLAASDRLHQDKARKHAAGVQSVGPLSFAPARQLWEVAARSPKPLGRGRPPRDVIGEGKDELAALWDLMAKLRA